MCYLIATLSWGAMFPIMTDALTRMDPYTFTPMRYGIAGIAFVIALVLREGKSALSLKGERAGLAWLIGSAGFVGFGFLVFLGQKLAGKTGALTASIMMATMPMLGVLVNWVLRKIVPPKVSIALVVMSFCGVATVITKGDFASLLHSPSNYGANVLIILGALCWVIYTVGAAFFPKWSPYKYTAVTTVLGMTSVLVINGLLYASGVVPVPSVRDFAYVIPHVLYMAFVAGFIGVLCWNIGNKILTPLNGTLFMGVIPLTAFMISAFAGVPPQAPEIIGACITGSALILNNLYMRRRLIAQSVQPSAPMSRRFAKLLRRLGIKHKRTRPYTPLTNGKAERFIQTLLREWAYAYCYPSSDIRAAELQPWMQHYNFSRPHSAVSHKPPASRLGFDGNNVLRNYI